MNKYDNLDINVLSLYPTVDEKQIDHLLSLEQKDLNHKIIVLDDDPTGTQTVHNVSVYTNWELETFQDGFSRSDSMFFILTNSRSFSQAYTKQVHQTIGERISQIAQKTGQEFILISRSDSTLRGHFPLETAVLNETFSSNQMPVYDGEIICPFFPEGGRYTMNDIHYVKEGNSLIPAGETEFSKDKTFPYTNSNLLDYIEEKSNGDYLASNCISFSIEELRSMNFDVMTEKLMNVKDFQKIIVNAIDYVDIKLFCICLTRAIKAGKHFLIRSAAAFPKVLGSITNTALLSSTDFKNPPSQNGGIVIIGSHVNKTSAQLDFLKLSKENIVFLEFDTNSYFRDNGFQGEADKLVTKAQAYISSGQMVVIYTSRKLLIPDTTNKDDILAVSVEISNSLTSIIKKLEVQPRFVIAKGGITSSDVATKGLGIKKAMVMGQIKPGIPVWLTGNESKFPNLPYIIFPGNVGEISTLREIVEELMI